MQTSRTAPWTHSETTDRAGTPLQLGGAISLPGGGLSPTAGAAHPRRFSRGIARSGRALTPAQLLLALLLLTAGILEGGSILRRLAGRGRGLFQDNLVLGDALVAHRATGHGQR